MASLSKLKAISIAIAAVLLNHVSVSDCLVAQSGPESPLLAAEQLIKKGNFLQAIPICLDLVKEHPGLADAHVLLGIAYAALEENEDAVNAFRRAIQLDPSLPAAHANLGIVYMQLGKMEQAAAELARALALGEQGWTIRYNMALCYSSTGKLVEARSLFLEVVSTVPNRPEPRLSLASVQLRLGEKDAALRELEKAELLAPDDSGLREEIGTLLLKHSFFEDAVARFEFVVKNSSEKFSARLKLAEAHLRSLNYSRVLKVLLGTSEPKQIHERGAVHYLLGAAYAGLQDWLNALDHYEKAAKEDPKPLYYSELISTLLKAGAMEDALKFGRVGAQTFPDSIAVLNALGNAAVANRANEEAIQVYRKIIELTPGKEELYLQLGNIYLTDGQFEKAQEIYSSLHERFPESENSYFGFALVQIRQGKFQEAKNQLEKVIEINPRHAGALYYLGKALYLEGKFEQALQHLTRSVDQAPPDSEDLISIHYQMAQCYLRLGDKENAQREFAIHSRLRARQVVQ